MFDFFVNRKDKLLKFFIIGTSLALLNLLLIYFFVEILLFNTKFLENVANIIVIEIGIILSFIFNRNWTWKNTSNNVQKSIFVQLLKFHSVVGFTAVIRIGFFGFFQWLNFNYLFNTLLCIIIASVFNFVLYDLKVFNEK